MAFALGLYTSDPNLLRCDLARVRDDVGWELNANDPLGAGWYAEENVLLQRYSAHARPASPELLGGVLESEALLAHGGPLPSGLSLEENTQPFRFRRWLFLADGVFGTPERFRTLAFDDLPDHAVRPVKGGTPNEVAFAVFLAALREIGRSDDAALDVKTAVSVMGAAARRVEALALEAGARSVPLTMMASNGRLLVAAALGGAPLYYRLLEGAPSCDLCELHPDVQEDAALRAHLRRKTVAIATHVRDPQGWIAVGDARAIAVGSSLHVESAAF